VLHANQRIATSDGWLIADVRISTHPGGDGLFSSILPGSAEDWRDTEHEKQSAPKIAPDKWETWPPERELIVAHEYLVRTKDGQQKYAREHRMSFLGRHSTNVRSLLFNARSFAGTQEFNTSSIIATKDLGKSDGRESTKRYMNKIVR
jgi:hypothetical protein